MLHRVPAAAFLRFHVRAILRRAGQLDVVGHHDRSGVQPPSVEDALEVGEIGGLIVVDEDEVHRAAREAVLRFEPRHRVAAVAQESDDHGRPITDARVVPDAAGDSGVRLAELDRVEPSLWRHHTRHPERAVAAVGPELEQPPRADAPHGPVEDLSLLVTDVHHDALLVAELVDDPDDVVDVARSGVGRDVGGECLLASIAYLPVRDEVSRAEDHAQHRPSQERNPLAAELRQASHALTTLISRVACRP